MRITLDQVENLRKRVDCDYQTGEKALRKSRGDIDGAVLYLKKREDSRIKKLLLVFEDFLNKIFSFDILMIKNDKKVIAMPAALVLIVVVLFNIPMAFLLIVALIAVISDYSFEIGVRNQENGKTIKESEIKDNVVEKTEKTEKTDIKSDKTYDGVYKSLYNVDVVEANEKKIKSDNISLKSCEEDKEPCYSDKSTAYTESRIDEQNCNEIIIE
ncbi:hypothetical protein [Alkalibacter saccharofermentans]|uniref:DUF4342 domain-containing protein n=1 Tax=Alkalibacter saccharofermentans DSM 14828 TaxID=1120975 RepID=A0A1M4UA66_9FIRM|nr:hypothetical protein [Alkalibacter saccharofermentans]SHE53605.1 hypothetical protein SAMN02746064_00697 [Alkalibacter saccharofermentans DSM 14828]